MNDKNAYSYEAYDQSGWEESVFDIDREVSARIQANNDCPLIVPWQNLMKAFGEWSEAVHFHKYGESIAETHSKMTFGGVSVIDSNLEGGGEPQ